MSHRTGQSGFTLVEITVVLAVLAMLAAVTVPAIFDRIQSAKVEGAISQARGVLQICDLARKRVLTSTRATNLQVTHSYRTLNNFSSTTVLQSQFTATRNLPVTNAFQLPILVRYDAERCYVAVDLDFSEPNVGGHVTQVLPNGNTRIIVSSRPKLHPGSDWVGQQKRIINNEQTR